MTFATPRKQPCETSGEVQPGSWSGQTLTERDSQESGGYGQTHSGLWMESCERGDAEREGQ